MPDWSLWLIAAALFGIGEVVSLTFFLGPIALAAALAAVVAALGAGLGIQIAVFIVGSIASLLLIRPIARKHLRQPAHTRTGTAKLVGERALVLERVTVDGGQVKIGGEVWSARPYDSDDVIEAGQRVQVLQIEGANALVSE